MGVPLDDTWIHFRFAETFASGHFFEYNLGEPTAGTTSPLYVLVLAAASFVSSNYVLNSISISAVFHLLSCILSYKLALSVFTERLPEKFLSGLSISVQHAALLATLLTVFTGRFVWAGLSGMETTMFAFFTLASVYSYLNYGSNKNEILLTSALAGLAVATRPEGLLLMLIITLSRLYNYYILQIVKKQLFKLLLGLLLFSSIALPYFIFSYSVSGHFFPNTYKGQGGELSAVPGFNYLRIVCIYFFRDNLLTGLLYITGFAAILVNFRSLIKGQYGKITLIFAWVYLLPLVSSFLVPNWRHHMRYTIPLIPFVGISSVYFLAYFLNSEGLARVRGFIKGGSYRINYILAFSLIYYSLFAFYLGKNTQNINDQQVKLANWVKENVPANETIAVNDIGAITFISKNRVVDMAGLVTPEVLRYRQYNWDDNLDSMNSLLKKNNVRYIIIYDHWFKEYLDKYEKDLQFVTSAYLEHNTICGGVEMKVYKTNF